MANYVGAIDQGTTSSRFILFDRDGRIAALDQREHEQITPRAGWVEHDAAEIWRRTREVIGGALAASGAEAGDIAAIGITNQRETAVIWDRADGRADPQRDRVAGHAHRRPRPRARRRRRRPTGCATASGCRCRRTSPARRSPGCSTTSPAPAQRAESGELAFGTIDTWVLWNLTGGADGGVHATDVTNASRTMLMDLQTLDWHEPSLR